MRSLLIATKNKKKRREIKDILGKINFKILDLEDIGFDEKIKETGKTYKENAVLKAETVGKKTGYLTLSEDSGLEVDALAGAPGIYSARFAKGTDKKRIEKLLEKLQKIPQEKRTARFQSCIVLYDPLKKKTYSFTGISEGYITKKPLGKGGFGYDPVFFNLDLGKTNSQATRREKNQVSHRAKALKKARKIIKRIPDTNGD